MIVMYHVWTRPKPADTETIWSKIDQLAGGYRLSRAYELAARLERQFPEDEIAILPISGTVLCPKATLDAVMTEAEALYLNLSRQRVLGVAALVKQAMHE